MNRKDSPPSHLSNIPVNKIRRNPDNPRLFFRTEELASLMDSIKRNGVLVPITVYQEREHFVLIDGERRWRCADKLNIKNIPALVQPKPTPLNNLLLMFNIHALREQWDYFTIANKLPVVIELFIREMQREPNEVELSEITGLTRGQIRRCRFLIDLPNHYKEMLVRELALPKQKQQLSEDFFIEMERSLKTVQHRIPSAVKDVNDVRNSLIDKFRHGVIPNITGFRKLSKIATSVSNLGIKEKKARDAIVRIFDASNSTGIDEVFTEHFELRYDERKVSLSVDSIYEFLLAHTSKRTVQVLDAGLVSRLKRLHKLISRVLEEYE